MNDKVRLRKVLKSWNEAMHISKGSGLWMWAAAVDHRDVICFLQTEMMKPHHTPCPQSGYLWTISPAHKHTKDLPEVGEVKGRGQRSLLGEGESIKEVSPLRNGGKITLILYFSHNNNNFSTRDSSVLLSLEQPSEFPMSSFPRSLYQQKTDGLWPPGNQKNCQVKETRGVKWCGNSSELKDEAQPTELGRSVRYTW